MRTKKTQFLILVGALFAAAPAFAMDPSSLGQLGIETGAAASALPKAGGPLLGAEYTFSPASQWELGGFYDYNFLLLNDTDSGSIRFFGGLARFHAGLAPLPGLFVDAKLGATTTVIGDSVSRPVLGGGAGIGYRFSLGEVGNLSPHLGVRVLPDLSDPSETARKFVDLSLLFTTRF